MALNQNTQNLVRFPGLNTQDAPQEIGFRGLVKAENVDMRRQNKVGRRSGYRCVREEQIDASWSSGNVLIYQNGHELKLFKDDEEPIVLRENLTITKQLSAYNIGNLIYWSNSVETGVIDILLKTNRSFGITPPSQAPKLNLITGELPAGRYQVVTTYIREDGQESGSSLSALIDVPDKSGIIAETIVSNDESIIRNRMYLTTPDGFEFYRANEVEREESELVYKGTTRFLQKALVTQYLSAPPSWDMVEFYKSRLLFARDNVLYYSQPFSYELFDQRTNYIAFPNKITIIGSLPDNGVFIATDRQTFFLAGEDIITCILIMRKNYGGVLGTCSYVDSSLISPEPIGGAVQCPCWMSTRGICVGFPDGSVQNLTERSVAVPEGYIGTGLFRQQGNQNHYICVIKHGR